MIRIAALLLGISLAGTVLGEDWPQFLGPTRDGMVQKQNLPDKFAAGGPRQVWSVPVGEGFGGVSIHKGRVYLLDRVDDARDVLRCFGMTDGKEIWQTSYEVAGKLSYPGSRSTPTVDDKFIFTVGGFGHVHCFDRQTGTVVWAMDMRQSFNSETPNWGFSQSPLLYGEHVIVAAMNPQAGIVALDKATGEVAWKSGDVGGNTYASPKLYTLGGVEQVVFISSTGVSSVDPKTGKTLWRYNGYANRIPIPSPSQVDDKRLFVTGGYGSGSVMIQVTRNGEAWEVKELWKTTHGTQIHPAYVIGEHIFLNGNTNETLKARGQDAPGIICFDLDGTIKWTAGNEPPIERGGMIVVDGNGYLLNGQSGQLHLINISPQGFKPLDSAKLFETGGRNQNIWAPMALSNGYLILRDQQTLKCIDLQHNRQAAAR